MLPVILALSATGRAADAGVDGMTGSAAAPTAKAAMPAAWPKLRRAVEPVLKLRKLITFFSDAPQYGGGARRGQRTECQQSEGQRLANGPLPSAAIRAASSP